MPVICNAIGQLQRLIGAIQA